jgi:hypothetical protein
MSRHKIIHIETNTGHDVFLVIQEQRAYLVGYEMSESSHGFVFTSLCPCISRIEPIELRKMMKIICEACADNQVKGRVQLCLHKTTLIEEIESRLNMNNFEFGHARQIHSDVRIALTRKAIEVLATRKAIELRDEAKAERRRAEAKLLASEHKHAFVVYGSFRPQTNLWSTTDTIGITRAGARFWPNKIQVDVVWKDGMVHFHGDQIEDSCEIGHKQAWIDLDGRAGFVAIFATEEEADAFGEYVDGQEIDIKAFNGPEKDAGKIVCTGCPGYLCTNRSSCGCSCG